MTTDKKAELEKAATRAELEDVCLRHAVAIAIERGAALPESILDAYRRAAEARKEYVKLWLDT